MFGMLECSPREGLHPELSPVAEQGQTCHLPGGRGGDIVVSKDDPEGGTLDRLQLVRLLNGQAAVEGHRAVLQDTSHIQTINVYEVFCLCTNIFELS